MLELNKFLNVIKYRILAGAAKASASTALDEELAGGQIKEKVDDSYNDYLWLLILDLLVFVVLTFISYQASLKIAENTEAIEDPNGLNKLKFIKGLTYANGSKNIFIALLFFKLGLFR